MSAAWTGVGIGVVKSGARGGRSRGPRRVVGNGVTCGVRGRDGVRPGGGRRV